MKESLINWLAILGGIGIILFMLLGYCLIPLGGYIGWVVVKSESIPLHVLGLGLGLTIGYFCCLSIRGILQVISQWIGG